MRKNNLAVRVDRRLSTGFAHLNAPEDRFGFDVIVVFTSLDATICALRKAGILAKQLGAHITLLVPQVVPYHFSITHPPVLKDFNEKRFRVIASEQALATTVHILLCRSYLDALMQALRSHSLVLIGERHRWWPTTEARLAKKLRRAGHEVVIVVKE